MIKLAARHELVDMMYERPSLEEIFLAYYSDEGSGRKTNGGNGGKQPLQSASNQSGSSASKNSSEASTPRAAECFLQHQRVPERGASQNGNGNKRGAADAGMALQQAIEAIVEQTVEKTVNRMVEKGEKV